MRDEFISKRTAKSTSVFLLYNFLFFILIYNVFPSEAFIYDN